MLDADTIYQMNADNAVVSRCLRIPEDTPDFHLQVIDLLGNRVEAASGTAEFVACCSALCRLSVAAGLLVLGDMTVQGNVKSLGSLAEPLRVAIDNSAKRASIPICNKSNLLDVSAEILEHGNAIFKGAPQGRGAEGAGQGVGNTNRLASLQPGHPSSAFDSTMR